MQAGYSVSKLRAKIKQDDREPHSACSHHQHLELNALFSENPTSLLSSPEESGTLIAPKTAPAHYRDTT